jgi:hypothetical protein
MSAAVVKSATNQVLAWLKGIGITDAAALSQKLHRAGVREPLAIMKLPREAMKALQLDKPTKALLSNGLAELGATEKDAAAPSKKRAAAADGDAGEGAKSKRVKPGGVVKDSSSGGDKATKKACGRYVTDGYADALKNYEGSYKNPAAPSPKAAKVTATECALPTKDEHGEYVFADAPAFRPNLSPSEVLQRGSFGGTYFRRIFSSATGRIHENEHREFPKEWVKGLSPLHLTNTAYETSVNTYKVKCGGSLDMWQSSGWMNACDPLGWFQWYCRFWQGRRCTDDERQIGRFNKSAGPTGRFRLQLINKCVKANKGFADATVSPVIRQSLQHWGYALSERDFLAYCKKQGYRL